MEMERGIMDSTALIKSLTAQELTHLTYALVLVAIFFGLSTLYLAMKLNRLSRTYQAFMQGGSGENVETMLLARVEDIERLKQDVSLLQAECRRLDQEGLNHIQKVGVVRFNAFENTGSDLSFALAMTNAKGTGFVLSGIYGRDDSRVYAKPLRNGESSYALTKEEKKAIETAEKYKEL